MTNPPNDGLDALFSPNNQTHQRIYTKTQIKEIATGMAWALHLDEGAAFDIIEGSCQGRMTSLWSLSKFLGVKADIQQELIKIAEERFHFTGKIILEGMNQRSPFEQIFDIICQKIINLLKRLGLNL